MGNECSNQEARIEMDHAQLERARRSALARRAQAAARVPLMSAARCSRSSAARRWSGALLPEADAAEERMARRRASDLDTPHRRDIASNCRTVSASRTYVALTRGMVMLMNVMRSATPSRRRPATPSASCRDRARRSTYSALSGTPTRRMSARYLGSPRSRSTMGCALRYGSHQCRSSTACSSQRSASRSSPSDK